MQLVYAAAQSAGSSPIAIVDPTATTPADALPSSTVAAVVVEPEPTPTQTSNPQLPLLGRRVGLDPGHGPREDLGAVALDPDTGKLLLREDEFNLDVAMRARDILTARGASVVLTRESADTFTGITWPADINDDGIEASVTDDLQARIDVLNDFKAEAFLSIHANGGVLDKSKREDVQVLYCGAHECPFPAENRKLGRIVLDQLMAKLASTGNTGYGGELLDDLEVDSSDPPLHMFVLGPIIMPRHVRAVSMPGVITESLYVTVPAHVAQLNKDEVRQAIALAYADALQAYLTGE